MIRGLISTAVGFAAGYSLMRALEARAQGVPLRVAFQLDPQVLLTPVSRLGQLQAQQAVPVAGRRLTVAPPVDGDAPMTPEWAR